jgi:hypothetical protein
VIKADRSGNTAYVDVVGQISLKQKKLAGKKGCLNFDRGLLRSHKAGG